MEVGVRLFSKGNLTVTKTYMYILVLMIVLNFVKGNVKCLC